MIGHGSKLDRKQEEAIAALISCPTISGAAKSIEIGEATLRRWLKERDFREEYRLARKETVSHAIVQVQNAASRAVQTLEGIMEDTSAPVPSRVTAARSLLECAFKAVELEDIDERLQSVEALLSLQAVLK